MKLFIISIEYQQTREDRVGVPVRVSMRKGRAAVGVVVLIVLCVSVVADARCSAPFPISGIFVPQLSSPGWDRIVIG